MLKKLLKDAVSSAKKATDDLKKTIEDDKLKEKASDLLGNTPLPFSGLIKNNEPKKRIAVRVRKEKELPFASRRIPSLETSILNRAKDMVALSAYQFQVCIFPESTFRTKESDGKIVARIIRAFLAGENDKDQSVVRDVLFVQQRNEPLKEYAVKEFEDDSCYSDHPIEFLSMEDLIYEIPEEALLGEIKLKTRNVLSPVLVYNSLPQSIKIQSSNLETDAYQSVTIPGLGRKNFMYHSENGSGIRISYANSGKLIKFIPLEQVPMDAINVP